MSSPHTVPRSHNDSRSVHACIDKLEHRLHSESGLLWRATSDLRRDYRDLRAELAHVAARTQAFRDASILYIITAALGAAAATALAPHVPMFVWIMIAIMIVAAVVVAW